MPLNGCHEAHHVEVVGCALFATRNSLKSQAGRNLKSPLSNIRAVTSKLCRRSRPTQLQPAAPAHVPPSRFPPLEVFRRRPPVRAARFVSGRHPKTFTSPDILLIRQSAVEATKHLPVVNLCTVVSSGRDTDRSRIRFARGIRERSRYAVRSAIAT